jgi:hypothetical protein
MGKTAGWGNLSIYLEGLAATARQLSQSWESSLGPPEEMHLYLIHAVNVAGELDSTHQCIVVAGISPLAFVRGLTFHSLKSIQIFLKAATWKA